VKNSLATRRQRDCHWDFILLSLEIESRM
jgi:hypothetical protein